MKENYTEKALKYIKEEIEKKEPETRYFTNIKPKYVEDHGWEISPKILDYFEEKRRKTGDEQAGLGIICGLIIMFLIFWIFIL